MSELPEVPRKVGFFKRIFSSIAYNEAYNDLLKREEELKINEENLKKQVDELMNVSAYVNTLKAQNLMEKATLKNKERQLSKWEQQIKEREDKLNKKAEPKESSKKKATKTTKTTNKKQTKSSSKKTKKSSKVKEEIER